MNQNLFVKVLVLGLYANGLPTNKKLIIAKQLIEKYSLPDTDTDVVYELVLDKLKTFTNRDIYITFALETIDDIIESSFGESIDILNMIFSAWERQLDEFEEFILTFIVLNIKYKGV